MKSIKFLLVIAALLFVGNTGFSQSSKSNKKAVKKTDQLDSQIQSENPALALNESQKEQIVALQEERMNEVSAFREKNSNKDELKAKTKELNKAMNAGINEILTAEQAEALKVARKKMKAERGDGASKAKKKKKNKKKKKKN